MTMMSAPKPLEANTVHVWHASLGDAPDSATLSEDERERAARLLLPEDAAQFVAARAGLRNVLAGYCGVCASALQFEYGERGKPRLLWPSVDIEFNISHTGDRAIIAVTRAGPVGIDIERRDRPVDVDAIAQRFFAPEEVRALFSLPVAVQHDAFLRCWTRKEAYLKASADGMWEPLHSFVVSVLPEESPRLVSIGQHGAGVARWVMRDLDAGPGHVAALVVHAAEATVVDRGWVS
jgi:4'-phosphopantetheinyl transferase